MRGLYEKLSEWVSPYPALKSWLYFNTTDMSDGNTSLNSTSGHTKVKEFIDGSYDAELKFGLTMVMPYDTEQSTMNLDAFEEVSNFAEWVENNEDYPDFGEKYKVTDVYILDMSPNIAVDTQQSLAKYTFFGVVEYCYNA